MVKFGIIGCGSIAKRFAGALASSPVAELYACAARDKDKAEAFKNENGAEVAYGSYDELLADENVEAVYIATIHTTHAEVAKKCILAGKAVLCEKPFFVNQKEAEETIALAKEKNVLIMEGFWSRTVPAYLKVKEWIKEGRIGKLSLIRAAFCFCMPYNDFTKEHRLWVPEKAGGALLDAGVYPYEYVTGIMDGEPDEIISVVKPAVTGVDGTVAFIMKYKDVIADCLTSIEGNMDSTAQICGSAGFIKQYYFVGSKKAELYSPRGELIETYEDSEPEGFVHEIAHFVSLMEEGKTESDLVPLSSTLAFTKSADKMLVPVRKKTLNQPSKFTLDELSSHEEKYRFESFSHLDAVKLGNKILEIAEQDGKAENTAVQIEVGGYEVFRSMPQRNARFNDLWMGKKRSTVRTMGISTLRLWTQMEARGIKRQGGMEPTGSIITCGGGFPILAKDGSLLGVIAVSGPGDEYEHDLIVRALEVTLK